MQSAFGTYLLAYYSVPLHGNNINPLKVLRNFIKYSISFLFGANLTDFQNYRLA
jgi:hypothetical protein